MHKLLLLTSIALAIPTLANAQTRISEPWPYYKAQGKVGYEIYTYPGCAQYEQIGSDSKIIHICDEKSPQWLFKLRDKSGHGISDAPAQ